MVMPPPRYSSGTWANSSGCAHNSLSSQLGRRVDAEDVVQSAFNTFFAGAKDGRFNVERGQDLWRLLAVLTVTKLRKQVEFHTADKRNFQMEKAQPLEDVSSQTFDQLVDSEPSPQDAVDLLEQIASLKAVLGPKNEEILVLRLEGYHVAEIAKKTGRSDAHGPPYPGQGEAAAAGGSQHHRSHGEPFSVGPGGSRRFFRPPDRSSG